MEGFIGRVALKRNDIAGLRSKKNLTSFIRRSKINGTVLTVYGTHKAYCPAGWRLVKPANYTDLLVEAPAWDTGEYRLAAPNNPHPSPTRPSFPPRSFTPATRARVFYRSRPSWWR